MINYPLYKSIDDVLALLYEDTAFNHCIMHQHSVGYFPYKHYVNMGFDALEIHIDAGGPSAEQLFNVHKEILSEKPMIIWGDIPETDMDWIFSKLPVEGLAVLTVVDAPERSADLWERYCSSYIPD
ncbi:MAG: hypothetical protein IMY71_02795 [Bacteroidetes bacterium]|nr:hypothetical protein [Bacteroidota bacterium]